jgi:hypothetical protein
MVLIRAMVARGSSGDLSERTILISAEESATAQSKEVPSFISIITNLFK